MQQYVGKSLWLSLATLAMIGCGSATSTSSSTTGGGGSATTTTTSADVSSAVPSDVVLSSPTATASASANVAVRKAIGDADGADFAAKRDAIEALLAGTGECSFTFALPTVTPPDCYGPAITYINHPEADSKDADMVNNDSGFNDTDGDGNLPTGDLGFWSASEGTEACAAAQMNSLVDKVASKLDNGTSLFAAMGCAANKAGLELPAVGASVDLLAAMTEHVTISGLTLSAATVGRLADTTAGDAQYRSAIEFSVALDGGTQTGELVLTHVVTSDDTYKGKLAMTMRQSAGSAGGCPGGTVGVTSAGVIAYEKESATVLREELNYAEFCGGTTDPFTADYDIDADDKASESNVDGWAGNWNFGRFAVNPADGTGTVAYAWQAGANDGASRVLNVSVAAADDGSASGTAYFGYGADVSSTAELGEIGGFYCNWAGPHNRSTFAEKAQRQVLARAAGATEFTASSSNIAYAPTNNCDSTGTDGASHDFGFSSTSTTMDNDTLFGVAVANDLIDLSAISFTAPEAPESL